MKRILNFFDFRQAVNYRLEILSGITVALALIPEAVAFALIAGLSPLTGLYAAFMVGLVASVFGGRPGMISGATGAIAVIIAPLALLHGVEYVFAVISHTTGRSRGFGFVEMPNSEEGQAAIEALEGKDVMGRPIRCNESEQREKRRSF